MSNPNNDTRNASLWHIVNALARHAGGGVCKRVTVVAYFDAAGRCVGHEEITVKKLYPKKIFDILTGSNSTGRGGDLD